MRRAKVCVRGDGVVTVRSSAGASQDRTLAGGGLPAGPAADLGAGRRQPRGELRVHGPQPGRRWPGSPPHRARPTRVKCSWACVRPAGRWTIPGACGGSAADSLAGRNPERRRVAARGCSERPGRRLPRSRPDGTPSVLEPSPGEVPRAVALGEDAARLVVGMDVNGVGLLSADDRGEYLGLAWPGAPVTAVRTGAGPQPLAVGGDEQGNIVVFDADNNGNVCDVKLPVAIPIVAADVIELDGMRFVASATAKAVFVHHITPTDDGCDAELQSGFDLQREEGEVLDLSFRPDGTVAVLESDHFLFGVRPRGNTGRRRDQRRDDGGSTGLGDPAGRRASERVDEPRNRQTAWRGAARNIDLPCGRSPTWVFEWRRRRRRFVLDARG